MAANEENATAGNSTLKRDGNKDPNDPSADTQDQTLLTALQDLIVRVMDPMQKSDRNIVHTGPEAGKLITALQHFISRIIVRSQSEGQYAIEVNLDEGEEDKAQQADPDDDGDGGDVGSLSQVPSSELEGEASAVHDLGDPDTLEKPQMAFKHKLLKALREHIFNTMPIRLLCFKPHGSRFRIVLLERGAIYLHLALVFQGKMHEKEFQPQEMWFGGTETDEARIKRLISNHARYAILSHTWLRTTPGEVTYGDWNKDDLDSQSLGYRKLVNFCKVAHRDHGLTFGWMDTVCINKESSSELDESIRSMYKWYSRAAVCIVYLAETETLSHMYVDTWFTRGWTLQELLAPGFIKFYDRHWKQLADCSANDKKDKFIMNQIKQATTISEEELGDIRNAPLSRRMQLAATREVMREEDTAYSLMGIFNVSISTAYGEGAQRAFFRLLQAILASSTHGVLDLLNWAGGLPSERAHASDVLPSSPWCYTNRSSDKSLRIKWPTEPLTLTHLGLRVPVILMPGISIHNTPSSHGPIGDYNAIVNISPIGFRSRYYNIPPTYNLLDSRVSGKDGKNKDNDWFQVTFAVFNFERHQTAINLPKTCIAIGLYCKEAAGEVVTTFGAINKFDTQAPIVFELTKRPTVDEKDSLDDYPRFWTIELDELAKHGMQLISLYL